MAQRLLQDREGADDVGLDEFAGAVDRAVDMAFRGKVHHSIGLIFLEQPAQVLRLADAGLLEGVIQAFGGTGQRGQVCRIGQLVDVDDAGVGVAQQVADHGGADEAGAAGDEDRRSLKPHV
ncbi:hypothetical protein ACVMFB_002182 [Bradyrhizobium sp. USDA 4522]